MVAYKLILLDDAHTLIGGLSSWKWLHIICVILTFIMAVPLAFFLPNSPVEAKWLSTAEKVHTIKAIRDTQSGIKNSTWKWSQVREAFTDPKSWLFMWVITSLLSFNSLMAMQIPYVLQRTSEQHLAAASSYYRWFWLYASRERAFQYCQAVDWFISCSCVCRYALWDSTWHWLYLRDIVHPMFRWGHN